jgi:glutamyl-tRNA reductase
MQVEFDLRLMPDLLACVEASDVIFAASGSEEILIHKADVDSMPPASAAVEGMRRFFDISVPRNIASDINELGPAARVFNVDDLKEVVEANKADRAAAAAEAEILLEVCGRGVMGVRPVLSRACEHDCSCPGCLSD